MIDILAKLSRWNLAWPDKGIDHQGNGDYTGEENRYEVDNLSSAVVLGSEDPEFNGFHRLVLDIDHPAALVESSTPGHYHLVVDTLIPEVQWKILIQTLADAGVIEDGYAGASLRRGQTFIRAPWAKKKGAPKTLEDAALLHRAYHKIDGLPAAGWAFFLDMWKAK